MILMKRIEIKRIATQSNHISYYKLKTRVTDNRDRKKYENLQTKKTCIISDNDEKALRTTMVNS